MTSSPARVAPLRALVADSKHGPLPALLVSLTVVTGLVDAVSILSLGRVFVANMTGNVVLVGFAAAGAPGFSLSASLSALGGFLLGAFVAGHAEGRLPRRAALFATGTTAELVLFIAALIVVSAQTDRIGHAVADTERCSPPPGGARSDHHRADHDTDRYCRSSAVVTRRVLAVVSMLAGAVIGAMLILHAGAAWAPVCVVALTALIAAGTAIALHRGLPAD